MKASTRKPGECDRMDNWSTSPCPPAEYFLWGQVMGLGKTITDDTDQRHSLSLRKMSRLASREFMRVQLATSDNCRTVNEDANPDLAEPHISRKIPVTCTYPRRSTLDSPVSLLANPLFLALTKSKQTQGRGIVRSAILCSGQGKSGAKRGRPPDKILYRVLR